MMQTASNDFFALIGWLLHCDPMGNGVDFPSSCRQETTGNEPVRVHIVLRKIHNKGSVRVT